MNRLAVSVELRCVFMLQGKLKNARSRVGVSVTTSPSSKVYGEEKKKSKEVKTPVTLVLYRTTLLLYN